MKVFITGLGAITASGTQVPDILHRLLAGQHSISEISVFDLHAWKTRLGGSIHDFKPAEYLPDRKLTKVISRQDAMGIYAGVSAIQDSQWTTYRDTLSCDTDFNERTGIYVGSPGNKYMQQYDFLPLIAKTKGDMQAFAQHLSEEVHPMWLLRILPNNVLAYVGITYGFKGPNHNVTNHAVGGMQALIEAYHAIQAGYIDRAVVVGYDMGIEPQALFYYDQLGLISDTHLRPFDSTHNGTILAEGAAAITLESEDSLRARKGHAYAECLAGVSRTEGGGLFGIDTSGTALQTLMEETLSHASMAPSDVGLMIAHGNGNTKSDDTEAVAIQNVLPHAPPVTAFKWAMGHTLCAAGILDTALGALILQEGTIPGLPYLQAKSHAAQSLNVTATSRPVSKRQAAMVVSRGFASMNACLLMVPV